MVSISPHLDEQKGLLKSCLQRLFMALGADVGGKVETTTSGGTGETTPMN